MHESHFLLFVNSYGVVYRNGTKRMDVLITIKAGIGPEKAQWCTRKEDNRVGTQKIIPWKAIRVTVNGRDQDTRSKRPIVADSYFSVIRDIQFTTPFLKLRRSAANFPPNFQFWVLKQYTWLPQNLFSLPPVSMNSYRRTVREPDEMWGGGRELRVDYLRWTGILFSPIQYS